MKYEEKVSSSSTTGILGTNAQSSTNTSVIEINSNRMKFTFISISPTNKVYLEIISEIKNQVFFSLKVLVNDMELFEDFDSVFVTLVYLFTNDII